MRERDTPNARGGTRSDGGAAPTDEPGLGDAADAEPQYVVVPPDTLSEDALEALLQEFVTREGTDYGPREYSLQEKVQSVRGQLERGEVVIAFDLERASATLVMRSDLPRGPQGA